MQIISRNVFPDLLKTIGRGSRSSTYCTDLNFDFIGDGFEPTKISVLANSEHMFTGRVLMTIAARSVLLEMKYVFHPASGIAFITNDH